MNSLDSMMGVDPYGYPQGMGYPDDPMLQDGMMDDQAALMVQMGVPPMEDPYAMAGMEQPQGMDMGRQLSYDALGGASPQLGQEELNALAYSLGLGNSGDGVLYGQIQDPMYSPRFDTLRMMGGM